MSGKLSAWFSMFGKQPPFWLSRRRLCTAAQPLPLSAAPRPSHLPLVGALPWFNASGGPHGIADVMTSLYTYGNIVPWTIFGKTTVTVFDPAEFMKVHRAAGSTPSGAALDTWMFPLYYNSRRGKVTTPVAFVEGDEWKHQRHALQKDLFGLEDAASYLPEMDEVVVDASTRLPEYSRSGERLTNYLGRVTFELICQVCLAKRVGVLDPARTDPRDEAFVRSSFETFQHGAALMYAPLQQHCTLFGGTPAWRGFCASQDFIFERAGEHIDEHVRALEAATAAGQPHKEGSYLTRLLRHGELGREDVLTNVVGLLQGGVDTTANTLSWALTQLANNPSAQDALAAELLAVLGKEGPFTTDALPQLPLLKAVIRETHRMSPTVVGITRRLEEPIVLADTRNGAHYTIPARTRIMFSSIGMSLDPNVAHEPERFRPERWTTPSDRAERKALPIGALDHNLLAQPFSFGPRMCIGARLAQVEVWASLSRFVRDHRIELDPPHQTWRVRNDLLTKPEPYPQLVFTPRT